MDEVVQGIENRVAELDKQLFDMEMRNNINAELSVPGLKKPKESAKVFSRRRFLTNPDTKQA